jgi:hypothetical protein
VRISGLEAGDELDLRWFFGERDTSLGMRSNYGSLVDRLSGLSSGTNLEFSMSEQVFKAATRARLVSKALRAIPEQQARILCDAYGPIVETQLYPSFSLLADIVCQLLSVRAAHRAARSKDPVARWLASQTRLTVPSARDVVYHATREATQLLTEAALAYAQARTGRHLTPEGR